jgi:predicted Rossmann fold flavoprotein
VVVIGGGAAGLTAALAAAYAGAKVCIVEKNERLGKKILATGNGRCNLSNEHICAGHTLPEYHHSEFARPTLARYDCEKIKEFFAKRGLLVTSDARGWVYPQTKWANSVLDVLVNEIVRQGIECELGLEVLDVKPSKHNEPKLYQVIRQNKPARFADAIILATGLSNTAPALLQSLQELDRQEARPILAPLATQTAPLQGLDGVRANCTVTLYRGRQILTSEYGEVLFRSYGVSGIVSMNMSRFAEAADVLSLDFMPGFSPKDLHTMFVSRLAHLGTAHVFSEDSALADRRPSAHISAHDFLVGLVHTRIASVLLKAAQISPDAPMAEAYLKPLAAQLKSYKLEVKGVAKPEQAQVMRGGLAVTGFNPSTLESRVYPGLFAAGEALDVDGPCGGYNLHWAWASGLVAGQCAAQGSEHLHA